MRKTNPTSGESLTEKRTGAFGTGANGMKTGLEIITKRFSNCNMIPQQIRPTAQDCQTKKH